MVSLLDSMRAHLRSTDDSHRVTALELLFDLVFVYAITNVTGLMEHEIGAKTVLEGLIILAVVWFGWCSYAWLGNQAQADEGLLRVAMVVAMGGMFFVAISIPHAFEDDGNAAVVLVAAYAVVRLTHLGVYLIAAGSDTQLRSVILGMLGVALVMLVLLFTGAVTGGSAQRWWWLAAVACDQVGVYVVRSTRWRLNSASHFAERFGLVIIIAIGESIVAVGAATTSAELTGSSALALVCGLTIAVCLWWLYFDVVAKVAEDVLRQSSGIERVRLARDSYTYIHFLFVAGIVFAALGLVVLIDDHGRHRRRPVRAVRRPRLLPRRSLPLPAAQRRWGQCRSPGRRCDPPGRNAYPRRTEPTGTDRRTSRGSDRRRDLRSAGVPRAA